MFILDGSWESERSKDPAAALRLYYVAMTRARATLTLARLNPSSAPMQALNEQAFLMRRAPFPSLPAPGPMTTGIACLT